MMPQITLEHTFDAGHRIVGHEGKCARLHGHTYRVMVELFSLELVEPGFVVDFGEVKDLINQWDHYLLLWHEDPLWRCNIEGKDGTYLHSEFGIIGVPFNPTAENMARNLAERLLSTFALNAATVTLWETPKASAKWIA